MKGITPYDALEVQHQADALAWLAATGDIFRRIPPRTPPKHLVAYFVLRDDADGSVLLVDHRKAARWLPTGGHVEVGEDPTETVRREAMEELGVGATFVTVGPVFLTVTETSGSVDDRHTDVSLWYLLAGSRSDKLHPDEREFRRGRWWTPAEVAAADPQVLEPHLSRFLAKTDDARFARASAGRVRFPGCPVG